jgi:deoxyribodipyrimidine photo-lyase
MSKKSLVWFTQDLRLHDNPTLHAAHQHSTHVAHVVFIGDLHGRLHMPGFGKISDKRQQFIGDAVSDLAAALAEKGHKLYVFTQSAKNILPDLIQTLGIDKVYCSESSGYNETRLWTNMVATCHDTEFERCSSVSMFEQHNLPFPDGTLPKHFTEFRTAIEKACIQPRQPINTLVTAKPIVIDIDVYSKFAWCRLESIGSGALFKGGEVAALEHLKDYFSGECAASYKTTRNNLQGFQSSTKLSLWLAQGSLSVAEVYRQLKLFELNVEQNESTYWIWFELLWREFFFWRAKQDGVALFRKRGRRASAPFTTFYPERFRAWSEGKTPWPIVNACMKELRATGYLSNRGRQIVASCLVNELDLDWRYGATFFEQHLLDYDVGSNWGNWQYLAGVGADPRGKRHFNLTKQQEQFDQDRHYINEWNASEVTQPLDSRDAADWPIST